MARQSRKFRKLTTPVRLMGGLSFAFSVLGGAALQAQPVTDFRLPPATSTPPTSVTGPTDPDHPVAAPTPAPSPATPPTVAVPAATATPAQMARPTPQPTPAPRRDTPEGHVQPSASATPVAASSLPTMAPSTAVEPMLAPPASPVLDGTGPTAALTAETTALPEAANQSTPGGIAWWWLIPAVLAGAGVGAVLLRRRAEPQAMADQAPALPVTEAAPDISPPLPSAAPAAELASGPELAEAATAALFDLTLVDIALEPIRLSVSLVNATLQYRLRLDNRSAATVGPIAVAIDMISAHASLSEDSQLGRDGTMIELRHELPALTPGENAETIGELRLPLGAVTPIRSGAAVLLVPLIRIRMAAGDVALSRAMVVGEPPIQPGGPLRPFRLDQGPRVFTAVIQRPLAA